MLDMTTIGYWLFWLGASIAYGGTLWLPSLAATSRKVMLWVSALTAVSGWVAMFAALSFSGYGRTWLDMPAAYIAGGLMILVGAIPAFSRP